VTRIRAILAEAGETDTRILVEGYVPGVEVAVEGLVDRSGLEVLAINVDSPETVVRVRPFVRQSGWTFKVLLDSETKATTLYNPRKNMPMMHIFDADGRIVYSSTTYQPGQAQLLFLVYSL